MPSKPPFSLHLWTCLKKRFTTLVKSLLTRGWLRSGVVVGLTSSSGTMECTERRRPGVYVSAGMCAAVRIYMKFSAYVGFLFVIFLPTLIPISYQCIGDESLAIICQLFCEDYRGRSSGGPDLFVWNSELRSCKFVEVKGPGDIARENQKFWFDSLLSANIDVEICHVIDKNATTSTSSRKRKAKTPSSVAKNRKTKKASRVRHDTEEEEDYDQLDLTPEDGFEGPLFTSLQHMPPEKRRRISDPDYQPAHWEENQELPFPSGSKALPYLKHTSPVRRRNEVLITSPSKPPR